jgi:hypothetical protein
LAWLFRLRIEKSLRADDCERCVSAIPVSAPMQFAQLKRREFISLLGAAAAWPLAARGQQSTKVPRIGFLITAPLANPQIQVILEAFRQELHEFGYKEGQNIVIEYRTAEGNFDRFPSLAQDLIGLNVCACIQLSGSPRGAPSEQHYSDRRPRHG